MQILSVCSWSYHGQITGLLPLPWYQLTHPSAHTVRGIYSVIHCTNSWVRASDGAIAVPSSAPADSTAEIHPISSSSVRGTVTLVHRAERPVEDEEVREVGDGDAPEKL